MVDDPDETIDANIAQQIVKLHQKRDDALDTAFSPKEVKRYVAYAKTLKPKVLFFFFCFG
jgi:DNA replication licensing factor MCM6